MIRGQVWKVMYGAPDGVKVEGFSDELRAFSRAATLSVNRPNHPPGPVSFAQVEQVTVDRHALYLRDGATIARVTDGTPDMLESHRLEEPRVIIKPRRANYVLIDDRWMPDYASVAKAKEAAKAIAKSGYYVTESGYRYDVSDKVQVLSVTYADVVRFDLAPGQRMSDNPGGLIGSPLPCASGDCVRLATSQAREARTRREATTRQRDRAA